MARDHIAVFDIFVSYRTMDARYGAASAHEALAGRFGRDRVFLDSASIPAGARYPEEIYAALDQVNVLVVLIGPEWISTDGTARPIDREDDWVRREIRHAISRKIMIVPVLLDGVSLPGGGELPEDVRDLVRHQYIEVRHRSLADDLARLGDTVAQSLRKRQVKVGNPVHALRLLAKSPRARWWWIAGAAVVVVIGLTITLATVVDNNPQLPPDHSDSLVEDPRTADPCTLIDAATFARFGGTKLNPAYGNFNRCDVVISPEKGPRIDVEVQFDDGPLQEGAKPSKWVGAIGIVRWQTESQACVRALPLPRGNGDRVVIVSADIADRTGTAQWCKIADLAADAAADRLDQWHRAGRAVPRRSFPSESIANQDACLLPDGDALTAIPGIDAAKPNPGYGHWKCQWSTTNGDAAVDVRFDQSEPLDASDGRPTEIDGRRAFLKPNSDGPGTCELRVVYRTHPGLYAQTVMEILLVTISDRVGKLPVCKIATTVATSAAAALPR